MLLLLLLLLITPAQAFDFGKARFAQENDEGMFGDFEETCRQALGLESGKLTDTAFSASSRAGESSSAAKARFGRLFCQMRDMSFFPS